MSWYVYLLKCADDTFYTGISTDLKRRLYEHNNDDKKAAKYTRARRPLNIVYFELCQSRSEASVREYEIRKLNRKKKSELASSMLSELPGMITKA